MRAHLASPNGRRLALAKPETAAHRAKLDSDKFDDEAAGDQTDGLIESGNRLKFSIASLISYGMLRRESIS